MSTATKTFNLSTCEWVGFDLDHTLVRYHVPNLEKMLYDITIRYIVEHHPVPARLKDIPFSPSFVWRGLVIDHLHGNLLKLRKDKTVEIAAHGFRFLTPEEINQTYPTPLEDFDGAATDHLTPLTTFFERYAGSVFAAFFEVVDEEFSNPEDRKNGYATVNEYILQGLYFNYGNFEQGYFFPSIKNNPERYLFKRDDVKSWLIEMKKKGIRLFLLTNSRPDYTKLLMDYCYGEDWLDLFDLKLYHGRKPLFWISEADFEECEYTGEGVKYITKQKSKIIKPGVMYQYGNGTQLDHYFRNTRRVGDYEDPIDICYFGDHLIGDIMVPKNTLQWYTIAIVEEVEIVENNGAYVSPLTNGHELFVKENALWGSYFYCDEGKNISFWKDVIINFSNLCISCVSSFTSYPIDQTYVTEEKHISYPCILLQKPVPSYTLYYNSGKPR